MKVMTIASLQPTGMLIWCNKLCSLSRTLQLAESCSFPRICLNRTWSGVIDLIFDVAFYPPPLSMTNLTSSRLIVVSIVVSSDSRQSWHSAVRSGW